MVPSRRMTGWFRAASVTAIAAALTLGCAGGNVPESDEPATRSLNGPAGQLHVDDGGRGGLPVVFVHSFAGSSAHWSAQLAHLRPTRRAVALDLRGHGKSNAPASGGYSVNALASDIGAVVDQLGLQRFVLVGHSMGGAAAIAYAGADPERVAGLVLVGTPGKSSPELANQVMTSMRANYEEVSEGYWKTLLTGAQPNVETQIRGEMKRLPRDASLAIIAAIFAYDPLPALRAYQGPRLLLDTSHGEGPESLHAQAPEVPRQVITGTSHWPHMDKPDEFNRILDEFLANLDRPAPAATTPAPAAPTTPAPTAPTTAAPGRPGPSPWEAARRAGVEFRAVGQEPGWALTIDEGKSIQLLANYGEDSVVTRAPQPTRDSDGAITYRARTTTHDVTVLIRPTPCQDGMSGEAFSHTVKVRLNGQEMTGCGRMLSAPHITGTDWKLKELNGAPAVPSEAHFRLVVDGSQANGSTGCNSMRGPFELTGDRLRFGALVTTRRACLDPALSRQEQEFVRVLREVDRFTVQGETLTLFAGDRAVARFTAGSVR